MEGFHSTPAGKVPQVRTRLGLVDHWGTLRARIGFRTDYMIHPGLYRIGEAGPESPVLVTGNYKLTFDSVRAELGGLSCWLLVTDTDGINVWCAGGKGKFCAESIAEVVRSSGLERVVSHRTLILPQLAANGVAAHGLKRLCGFGGIYGPILARDLKRFLENDMQADHAMRRVTFTLGERMVLAPVEVALSLKLLAWVCLAGFLLSGIGPTVWSLSAAWSRGLGTALASVTGLLLGALAVPALLPHLPGRIFAMKGALVGFVGSACVLIPWGGAMAEVPALVLWATSISSFMAMNFTGSTPYTSPTGVEREMKLALPWQAGAAFCAVIVWLAVPFFGGA